MSGAVPLSGELDGWTQQMRTIAESSCLRISLISHSQPSMKVLTLSPPIFKFLAKYERISDLQKMVQTRGKVLDLKTNFRRGKDKCA